MFASEKDVAIDGFTCKAYRASNFEIVRHMFFNLIAYFAFSGIKEVSNSFRQRRLS